MGASCKLYSPKLLTPAEVPVFLQNVEGVEVLDTLTKYSEDHVHLTIECLGETRGLHVFLKSGDFLPDQPFTGFNLGVWGKSVEILRLIGEHVGGYLIANDCVEGAEPEEVVCKADFDFVMTPTKEQAMFLLVARTLGIFKAKEVSEYLLKREKEIVAIYNGDY